MIHSRLFAIVTLVVLVGCSPPPAATRPSATNIASTSTALAGKEVWFISLTPTNTAVRAIGQALNNVVVANGGVMRIAFSVNPQTNVIDLSTQAAAIDRAMSKKPAAIAYFVADPKSPGPQVTEAMKQGIPVFAVFGKPDGFVANAYMVLQDFEMGKRTATYLSQHLAKGAEVAIISGPLTQNIKDELDGASAAFQAEGNQVDGDSAAQRNLTNDSAGGQAVMQALLQRFPNLQGVFTYDDATAIGAAAAAKAAGKQILFASRNATPEGIAAIKDGTLLATCDLNTIGLGQSVGNAIIAQVTGKQKYENSEAIPPLDASNCVIHKDNVDQFVPADQRIPYVDIPQG
ncbi:MAG TPA: substrate-binding domain-containing protein [Chloroflexota bacterium]|jgi:ribose transport system substrate-binding protein|nr:substrate-binding domain-containing protein [Chloroflexota bacterium]